MLKIVHKLPRRMPFDRLSAFLSPAEPRKLPRGSFGLLISTLLAMFSFFSRHRNERVMKAKGLRS
jgi:hypothetical protein